MIGDRRMVAVAGAKGSPGISTVALGLALELAQSGLDVLLVDADAEAGCLGLRLLLDEETDARPLVRASGLGGLTSGTVRRAAVAAGNRLAVLDASGPEGSGIDGPALVAAWAEEQWSAVIVDTGHHLGQLQLDLAARADWVLWVVNTDRLALIRADAMIGASPHAGQSAGIVINRTQGRTELAAGRALAQRHGLPVMAAFACHRGAGRWGARRGVNQAFGMTAGFRELARTLHPRLLERRLGGVWP